MTGYAVVAAVIVGLTAASAIITRIMAIPQVSDWLTRVGLGPAPAQRGLPGITEGIEG